MNPIVIDNGLSPVAIDSLYTMFKGPEMKWTFFKDSIDGYDPNGNGFFFTEEPTQNHPQFRYNFVKDNEVYSDLYPHLAPLLELYENCGLGKPDYISRIKANLLVPYQEPKLQPPHTDTSHFNFGTDKIEHSYTRKTLLYYVNNSDGDTVFYNERWNGEHIGKLTVQQRVSPRKGRVVIFDSNQIHSACAPTDKKYRIVVNCVFGR
jgi:hypothetical protein